MFGSLNTIRMSVRKHETIQYSLIITELICLVAKYVCVTYVL